MMVLIDKYRNQKVLRKIYNPLELVNIMEKNNKWSRNQKIQRGMLILNFIGLIATIIGLIITAIFLIKTSSQQIIIKQNVDEIESKLGSFYELSANNASIQHITVGNATLWYNGSCFITKVNNSALNICL